MEVNWQDIFYIMSSLVMLIVLITSIWFMWVLYNAGILLKKLTATAYKWGDLVNEFRYFKETVKINFSKFLLKVLGKDTKKI